MIDKWLKAGVLEDETLRLATEGTPQGGVISPMLSNIFLHHVLDEWFEAEVRPRMLGECTLVRFADDFVMTFKNHRDAKRVLEVRGNGLHGMGSRCIPTRPGSSTSAPSAKVARIRTAPNRRSTFWASPTPGRSHSRGRTWYGNGRRRAGSLARCSRRRSGVGSTATCRSSISASGCLRSW